MNMLVAFGSGIETGHGFTAGYEICKSPMFRDNCKLNVVMSVFMDIATLATALVTWDTQDQIATHVTTNL